MIDTEFHKPLGGPLAPPGDYQVTVRVGDWSQTRPFRLLKDPRVSTSDADLAEQFELQRRIQDKLSELVGGVNTIRTITRRLDDWTTRVGDTEPDLKAAMSAVRQRLAGVEAELVQREFTADGDTLNYREQLFEKLASLPAVVGSADARPTASSYQVFDKLAGQIDLQLASLATIVDGDLAAVNDQLAATGLPLIGA